MQHKSYCQLERLARTNATLNRFDKFILAKDGIDVGQSAEDRFIARLVEFITESAVKSLQTLVDAGCGTSSLCARFAKSYRSHYFSVDAAFEALRQRGPADTFEICVQARLEQLPFPNEIADGVLCLDVLHLVEDAVGALEEIHRILKPGGWAAITTFADRPDFGELVAKVEATGLSNARIYDDTQLWRTEILAKHRLRYNNTEELKKWFGATFSERVIRASTALLGLRGATPLVDQKWRSIIFAKKL